MISSLMIQSDKSNNAVGRFFKKVEKSLDIIGRTPYVENSKNSAIAVMNKREVQTMDHRTFQEKLRSHHIVVIDVDLSPISCDRRGLGSLNGLKEMVDMEGIIIKFIHLNIY